MMVKKHTGSILFVLLALTVILLASCEVASDALSATLEWDYPTPAGCYTVPADGFLVRVVVNGAEVKTDTVFVNTWQVPIVVGTTRVKVASFWNDGGVLKAGMATTPDCAVLPDTLWSAFSEPITVEAQSGAVSGLRIIVGGQ